MEEIWKDVKGYEGLYQVNNFGNVKSLPRYYYSGRHNNTEKFVGEKIKKVSLLRGYPAVSLSNNKNKKRVKVHRIVAEAFLLNPNDLPQINHKDGNKTNNNVENLEWCDGFYNQQHSIKTGLRKGVRGEKSHYAKLTRDNVLKIKQMLSTHNNPEIAELFGVNRSTISMIRCGKTWTETN